MLFAFFSCNYSPPSTNSGSGGKEIQVSSSSSTLSSSTGTMNSQDGGGGHGGMSSCSSKEICNGIDDDCNGLIDDLTIDSSKFCGYPQMPFWIGNHDGLCNYGKTKCVNSQLICSYVSVMPEVCGDNVDNDCDEQIDENCSCVGTEISPCYSGNPDVIGVGVCKWGISACDNGINDGVCISFIPQSNEKCNGEDDDCDGVVDNVEDGCP
jgi:hypothetical protein